jgi:GUN4-like
MDDRTAPLAALLDATQWRAADLETRRLLIEDADVGGYVGVDADEAGELSCELLAAIDTLWATASDGRFGFAAQERILARVMDEGFGGNDTWREFGRAVGWVAGREWIEDTDVVHDITAPEGHLPYVPGSSTVVNTGRIYEGFVRFYARVGTCLGE